MVLMCVDGLPTVPGWRDCDDADPRVHQLVFHDPDSDGFATSTQELWLCVGDTIPEGYALNPAGIGDDCVEGDPGIHPDATDIWGDGLDFDCDGFDPPSCAHSPLEVPLEAPLSDACVDAPDVFVSTLVTYACSSTILYYFFVGNRGHAPFEGAIHINATGDTASVEPAAAVVGGPLAPGETTEVQVWTHSWTVGSEVGIVVELFDAAGAPMVDCDETNQVAGHDGVKQCSCK
jgi:hypothetical protein